MHRIECLKVSGFKSFRTAVSTEFPGAVNAIVGPNGCGKSNICDAFLWVLGEQSARVLRGNRMEDVIFNGTQRYGPLGMADVTLRLKYIPSPGDDEQALMKEDIEITRRLYRDGASEYYLNGKRCRLLDIQEAFEGTGLGFTSYAIIEQGRIQNLLASKPLEKRALIEEVARIVSFKHRKKSALVKLELAHNNLLRIRDIIAEIERNLKSLKLQVQRAKRYRHLRDKMRAYLRIRYFLLGRELLARLDQNLQELGDLDAAARAVEADLQEWIQRLARERTDLEGSDKRLQEHRDRLAGLELHLQRIATSSDFLRKERQDLAARLDGIRQERQQLEERRREWQARQAELDRQAETLDARLQEAKGRNDAVEQEYTAGSDLLARQEKAMEDLRGLVFEEAGQVSRWRNQEIQLLEQDKYTQRQLTHKEEELAVHGAATERLTRSADGKAAVLDELRGAIAALEDERERLSADSEAGQEQQAALQARVAELEKEVSAQTHRLRSIEELEQRNEFYSDALKQVLPACSGHAAFRGTLADFLEAGPEFHPVVESFLRAELETVIVDAPELLEQGIELLSRKRSGLCHFLLAGFPPAAEPPDAGDLTGRPGVMGRLLDEFQLDSAGRDYLLRIAPGIGNVWLVADWRTAVETARAHPGAVCLALDGVAVSAAGRVSVLGAEVGKGILGYRHERKTITRTLQAAEADLQAQQAELQATTQRLAGLESRLEDLDAELQERRLVRVREEEELRSQREELQRHEQLLRAAALERDNLNQERAGIQAELGGIQGRIAELEQNRQARQHEFEECRQEIARLKDVTAELNRRWSEARVEYAAAREQLNAARAELERNRQLLADNENRGGQLDAETAQIGDRQAEIGRELEAFEQRHQEAVRDQDVLKAEIERQRAAIEASRHQLAATEGEVELRRLSLDEQREKRNQSVIQKTQLEGEIAHLEEGCVLEFHQPLRTLIAEGVADTEELDAESAQQKYLDYRDKAERMGSVNLLAVEEYEREEERLTFHRTQETDIAESILNTQKGIEEIDRRSARLFKETFEAVNINFQEMFTRLFGGGTCELRLVDEENLLESGVDIVASPPGKKLQNILLLSGGEKALTALALMLAIFKYRPSPFCLMDEVDAPLDESNIDRFVALVQQFSTQTQYVLITHNKRTMEIAETIYGITMEEAGVSKVISVQLKDVEKVLA
ncbi:MAG TPA: chromosome segregation protein SMC [Acidobacteriota bacterium]|nr:chromosome segregation protein SMC [Acidobacteriota bacterium]HNU01874.1 chromosome segregation protein SMC [Acidobacteriota bacterium]HPB28752.1 chromosome segregation protein SMC [Acidobacteriota bacterium]HQO26422.1 chromosome segregation protein SMC [Acidobacteriota bacterium]HQP75007.1 chromosome segregation protein SMC [Acidobacteriota bacterium]